MLARIVLLLLALPSLLMPPGVCVCQYARAEGATPALVKVEPSRAATQETAPRSKGCCKKCRAAVAAGSQTDPTRSVEPTPASPADRDHAPNCPAAGPSATAKLAEPPAPVPDLLVAVGGCPVDLIAEPTVSLVPPADTPSPPTPRYISYRSLLI